MDKMNGCEEARVLLMRSVEHPPWTILAVDMTVKIMDVIWAIVRTITTTLHVTHLKVRGPHMSQGPRINTTLPVIIRRSRRGIISIFTRATASINLPSPCPCPCRGIQPTPRHLRAAFIHLQTISTAFHPHILAPNTRHHSITTIMMINILMALPCKGTKVHDQAIWMMICIPRTWPRTLRVGTSAYPGMPLFPPHPSILDCRPRGLCGLQD